MNKIMKIARRFEKLAATRAPAQKTYELIQTLEYVQNILNQFLRVAEKENLANMPQLLAGLKRDAQNASYYPASIKQNGVMVRVMNDFIRKSMNNVYALQQNQSFNNSVQNATRDQLNNLYQGLDRAFKTLLPEGTYYPPLGQNYQPQKPALTYDDLAKAYKTYIGKPPFNGDVSQMPLPVWVGLPGNEEWKKVYDTFNKKQ